MHSGCAAAMSRSGRKAVALAVVAATGLGATVTRPARALEDASLEPCADGECGQITSPWPGMVELHAPRPAPVPTGNESVEVRVSHNGVDRDYGDGYSELVVFPGYSSSGLCTRYKRKTHIDGHTSCPLEQDWYQMWRPTAASLKNGLDCWIDDMRAYQHGDFLSNAPGTETILGPCPPPGHNATTGYKGGNYDFRYGGIRPQDNPDAALYPEIAAHIEDVVTKTGKKVVVRGCSGGTINGYAFLMSQTRAWRQKYVMAFVAVCPVFGGTISSIASILSGYNVGAGGDAARCLGRFVAERMPSVLWMWPHPGEKYERGEWNRTEVIVQTPRKNYTAYQFEEMLADMGLSEKTLELYRLEKNDVLGEFEPPMIDTYAFYGYGVATTAAWATKHNLTAELFGAAVCPPGDLGGLKRTWDDGDGNGGSPLRSTARAGAWAEAHKREGYVLFNKGYKGMGHSCSCTTDECKKDYQCVMNKLSGAAHPGC